MEHKRPELRQVLTIGVFIGIIGVFSVMNFVTKPPAILPSERRAPAQLPAFTAKSVISGEFMKRFENFAADRFVFRDSFRTLRAATVFGVFLQTDKSGLYFGASGAGAFKRLDPIAAAQTAAKIKKVTELLDDCVVYYSIVPDKSIYAGKYLPGFDPAMAEPILAGILDDLTYIPLTDCLNSDSFYRTDIHWDQIRIDSVAGRLCDAMGAPLDLSGYADMTAGEFRGVYAGQMALPMTADPLAYKTCPALGAKILNEQTLQLEDCPVYDVEAFHGLDPYDIFLHGAQALVVLENDTLPERALYLFRDSFSSSLAPLLAGAYSKVTLIDLRYIDLRVLDQFVEFTPGSDVLFLYGSQILNNPSVLKA